MNTLIFTIVLVVLLLLWFTWLVTFTHAQRRQAQAIQLQAEQKARVDAVQIPLRMQAMERLVLLLERIRPEGLVHRASTDQPAAAMQLSLMAQVRAEFEHNLAQQLYVSAPTWSKILQARDLVAGTIQQAGGHLAVDAAGILFARQLLQMGQSASAAIDEAVLALRREMESGRHA